GRYCESSTDADDDWRSEYAKHQKSSDQYAPQHQHSILCYYPYPHYTRLLTLGPVLTLAANEQDISWKSITTRRGHGGGHRYGHRYGHNISGAPSRVSTRPSSQDVLY